MAQQVNEGKDSGTKPVVKTNHFQPEQLVLTFNHAAQANEAQDKELKGFESAKRYYHISTPIQKDSNVMYRFQLKGYAYGCAKPLDIIWCGYPYSGNGQIIKQVNVDIHNVGFAVTQYYNSNKKVCLKFGPINRYCNGFALYYSAHCSKVEQGLKLNEYSVLATAEDGKI